MIKNIKMHRELAGIKLGAVKLIYSDHAIERSAEKRIRLLHSVNIVMGSVVELEIDDATGKPLKLVVRTRYDDTSDILLVLTRPTKVMAKSLFVKTVWLNDKNDKHDSLDLSRLG